MLITDDKSFLNYLKKKPGSFFVIHYSCQNLYKNLDGLSPKITSIVIANYNNGQTKSFATHTIAEELGIGQEELKDRFGQIELELLRQFYDFLRDHRDKIWVHWNMKSLTYGFEHLEHRYRALGGTDAVVVPIERRINLDSMLKNRYGNNYVNHRRLYTLLEMNWGLHRDIMTGDDEVKAFEENDFTRMHQSTWVKVEFFCWVMKQMLKGRLKTESRRAGVILDKFLESRGKKVATLLFNFLGALVILWNIISIVYSLGQ